MPVPTPVSSLLDSFSMGTALGTHHGITCYPAIRKNSDAKYIIKQIQLPPSQAQMDALLLTRAYRDSAEVLEYFRLQAEDLAREVDLLKKLSRLEGFLPYEECQISPIKSGRLGYEVFLVSHYRRSLRSFMSRHAITELEAVNLGLDMCSALSACRRSGYLYINLKPSNIYVSSDKSYRIGDLGFVALDSLRFCSLPEKYTSPYSAPETCDILATLNDRMDVFALGMLLYEIFNGGLPDKQEYSALNPPKYANEEMADILLKACHPVPQERYETPEAFGKALVAYMQRNSVNDVPIAPAPSLEAAPEWKAPEVQEEAEPEETQQPAAQEEPPALESEAEPSEEVPALETAPESTGEAPAAPSQEPDSLPEPPVSDVPQPEPSSQPETEEPEPPAAQPEEIPEEPQISDPQPPEMPEAEPEIIPEPEAEEDHSLDDELAEVNALLGTSYLQGASPVPRAVPQPAKPAPQKPVAKQKTKLVEPEPNPYPQKKQTHALGFLVGFLVFLLIGAAGCGGFWYYHNCYLLDVSDIQVSGTHDTISVQVQAAMPEALEVVCTDVYGNSFRSALQDGGADFENLVAGTLYRIEVEPVGMHKLTGTTSQIFTTASQAQVSNLTAVAGPEDGSVLLTFSASGNEEDAWVAVCTKEGYPTVETSFQGGSVTVTGLTVHETYTITIQTANGDPVSGENTIEFTALPLVLAQNLRVTSIDSDSVTIEWDENADNNVWQVRCYSGDFEEIVTTEANTCTFTGIDPSKTYHFEVLAENMTSPARTSISANPIRVTNFQVTDSGDDALILSWECEGDAPDEGWLLMYTADDATETNVVKCAGQTAILSPRIPNTDYHFTLQIADGATVFNNTFTHSVPEKDIFLGHSISAHVLQTRLLAAPSGDWTADTIPSDQYRDTFAPGESVAAVIRSSANFYLDNEDLTVLYVIRDGNGNLLPQYAQVQTLNWHDLWEPSDYHVCELVVPSVPETSGDYELVLYFDGGLVSSTPFHIG